MDEAVPPNSNSCNGVWAVRARLLYLPGWEVGQVRLRQEPTHVRDICDWAVTTEELEELLYQDTLPEAECKN